jgi:hypothetical protein
MRQIGSQRHVRPAGGAGPDAIGGPRRQRGSRLAESVTTREAIVLALAHAIAAARRNETPYPHWLLRTCLPDEAVNRLLALPFPPPSLGGISGKRELHNATRKYFDAENRARFPICEGFCQAFQDPRVTATIADHFGAKLAGTHLRVEFAQDTDGFWLEPHSDLGVKAFTMLLYISRDPQHATLGTDIYDKDKRHIGRSPFEPNGAMVFVPSTITFHGFERRPITGVRKSVIINYVTNEWRAREQLAFPERPV